jgi:pimeloyl-ACP methyl ester carboxylesterase
VSERIVSFRAGDGLECNLINVRGSERPTKTPVILVHGAGVRANIFRAPSGRTLVDSLVASGYDVWLENWRASIDLPPNEWTLDQAAVFDHPAAVESVVRETGASELAAIIHCQGSTSFMMSALAGLVPQVKTIVTNAVSLHTIVPRWSHLKLDYAIAPVGRFTRFLNPQWGLEAPTLIAKAVNAVVQLTHHECHNPVCKEVSFTYGSGFPALWRHENLNDDTHEWLKGEFAAVPMTFFNQIRRCVDVGHLVAVDGRAELPADFTAQTPRTDARFVFFAGDKNRCFLPSSQAESFRWFDQHRPGYHALHELPGYGHLDVFMGKNAARDVFPLMIAELERNGGPR